MILSGQPKNPTKNKIAAIYVRVSTPDQKDDATISSQIDSLCEYALRNGFEVPEDWIFRDDGFSGYILERPGLDNLRNLAREYPLDAILIYSPDRLARKYVFQLILEDEFKKTGIPLIYLKGQREIKNSEDMLLAHFQGIFAEYERLQILDRTRRGKLYKVRQGNVRMLPKAPFGYHNERDASFYFIKETEAQIVREIFHLFVRKGLKIRAICRYLENKEITAPRGGLKWDMKTISGMLGNPAYTGMAYYGKTESCEGKTERIVRYKKRGKVIKSLKPKRSKSPDLWEPISVPQIISDKDFKVAQELLKKNKDLASRNTKELSLLQGLLLCGLCGRPYYKRSRKKSQPTYTCKSYLEKGLTRCGAQSLKLLDMDELIWSKIIELLKNPELIREEIDRRICENKDSRTLEMRKATAIKKLKQIKDSQNKLFDIYQDGDCLSPDDLRERIKQLKQRETILRKELESLEATEIRNDHYEDLSTALAIFNKKLENSSKELSSIEKQTIIRLLVDEIVIFPNELKIHHVIPMNFQNCTLRGATGG